MTEEHNISIKEAQELLQLLEKLDNEQKKTVLNVLRGVALVACKDERGGA